MRSTKPKASATAGPKPGERPNAAVESDARRLGRRLALEFVGEDVPVLERIEFRPKHGADSEFWERGHATKNFSWTEVPQALAILFAEYSAWGKAGQHADFFFAGTCRGSLAASLGDAIHKKDDRIHELFVEAVASGKTVSRVKLVFGGNKGDNVHGKAKDKRDRRIAVNSNYLPPDCVEVIWERPSPTSPTEVVDVRLLANRIRESLGLPADKSGQVPESNGPTVGKEESLLRTPATPGPQQPLGDAPVASQPQPPTEEKIPADIQAELDRGDKLDGEGKYSEAQAIYESALQKAEAAGHARARFKARIDLAEAIARQDSDRPRAKELLNACLMELKSNPDPNRRDRVLYLLGFVAMHEGRIVEAKSLYREAFQSARSRGDRFAEGTYVIGVAHAEEMLGNLGEAHRLLDEAADIYRAEYRDASNDSKARSATNLGGCFGEKATVYRHEGKWIESLACLTEAEKWFRESKSEDNLAQILFLKAEALLGDSQWRPGLTALAEAFCIFDKLGNTRSMLRCYNLRARAAFQTDHRQEAIGLAVAAIQLAKKAASPSEQVEALGQAAALCRKYDIPEKAAEYLAEAKRLAIEHELTDALVRCLQSEASALRGEESVAQRDGLLREAISHLEALLLRTEIKGRRAYYMAEIGELFGRLGDLVEGDAPVSVCNAGMLSSSAVGRAGTEA